MQKQAKQQTHLVPKKPSLLIYNYFVNMFVCVCMYICIGVMTTMNSQAQTYVDGQIWVDGEYRTITVEQVSSDLYRFRNENHGINLVVMNQITNDESLCSNSGNSSGDGICRYRFNDQCVRSCDTDCTFDFGAFILLQGSFDDLPIVAYDNSVFPQEECYNKLSAIYWYGTKTLDFFNELYQKTVEQTNEETIFMMHSNGSILNSENNNKEEVKLFGSVDRYPDVITHELAHIFNQDIPESINSTADIYVMSGATDDLRHELLSVNEGFADIWSTLIESYAALQQENIPSFSENIPDYELVVSGLRRNFKDTYTPYRSCGIVNISHGMSKGWAAGTSIGFEEHRRSMAISHWFYLLAEGTSGETRLASFMAPINTDPSVFDCNQQNQEMHTIIFSINGIGHVAASDIVYRTIEILAEQSLKALYTNVRKASIQAANELHNGDCHILEQVVNTWYAMNVGDAWGIDRAQVKDQIVCEGQTLTITANNDHVDEFILQDSQGNTLATGNPLVYEQANMQVGDDEVLTLQAHMTTVDGIILNQPCTVTQDIVVEVKHILAQGPTSVCSNGDFTLTAEAHPIDAITAISWQDFNGIQISNSLTANAIAPSAPGTYTYTLTIDFLINGETISRSETVDIVVLNEPVVEGQVPDQSLCAEGTLSFLPQNYLVAENYQVIAPNGDQLVMMPFQNDMEIEFFAFESGTYTLVGQNSDCDPVSLTFEVVVGASITPTITGDLSFCPNGSTTLGTQNTYNTYTWALAGNVFSNAPTLTVTEAGTYTLTVGDDESCIGTATVVVEESFIPEPELEVLFGNGNGTLCGEETKLLGIMNYSEYVSYLWSTGETGTFIGVSTPDVYSVTVTDENDCTAVGSILIQEGTTPDPTILSTFENCLVRLTAVEDGADYRWLLDGSTIGETQSIEGTAAGTYTLKVTNTDGCLEESSLQISEADLFGTEDGEALTTTIQNRNITTWTTDKVIRGVVFVRDGKTLVIDGATIAFMDEQSGITVRPGGLLEIKNGALLKGHPCVEEAWRGIQVHGVGDMDHDITVSEYLQGQGRVRILSMSTIRDARTALSAPRYPDAIFNFIGGGQIEVDHAHFINNLTAINMYSYSASSELGAQTSFIKNSTFTNSAPFLGSYNPLTHAYTHISLGKVGQVDILGNTFRTTNLDKFDKIADRGIGIRLTNNRVVIGEEKTNANSPFSNIFEDLYIGIDAYSTLSLASVVDIVNNEFDGVRRGVVLHSAPASVVKDNTFIIPKGSSGDGQDTYGVLANHSFGSEISNNTFETETGNEDTKGLVLQGNFFNTAVDEMSIYDNWFEGGFGAATEFSGNNKHLTLQCNDYVEQPRNDWYLTENAQIDNQGICNRFDFDQAFSNNWHKLPPQSSLPPSRKHIRNKSSESVRVFYDKHSEPKWNDGLVVATDCSFEEGTDIVHSCFEETPRPDGPCGNGKPLRIAARTASTSVLRKQLECHFLSSANPIKYLTLDAAFSADIRDWTALNLITTALLTNPTATDEEKEVATVYNAIHLHQTSNDDATKAEQIVKLEGISPDSPMKPTAEASLALLDKRVYVRNSATILEEGTPKTNIVAKKSTVYPNPASAYIQVYLNEEEGTTVVPLTIYDTRGTAVKTVSIGAKTTAQIIDISDLAAGIYYCQIGTRQIEKLVIIR